MPPISTNLPRTTNLLKDHIKANTGPPPNLAWFSKEEITSLLNEARDQERLENFICLIAALFLLLLLSVIVKKFFLRDWYFTLTKEPRITQNRVPSISSSASSQNHIYETIEDLASLSLEEEPRSNQLPQENIPDVLVGSPQHVTQHRAFPPTVAIRGNLQTQSSLLRDPSLDYSELSWRVTPFLP